MNWVKFKTVFKTRPSRFGVIPAGVVSFFSWYYWTSDKAHIITYDTPGRDRNFEILQKCTKIHNTFYSTFWMTNPHVHTILSEVLRGWQVPKVIYEREKLITEDGGTLALDWVVNDQEMKEEQPIVFLYPGVTGHSQVSYVLEIATHLTEHGYRVVAMNQRGINCELTSAKLSCGGYTGDIEQIIKHIRAKYVNADIYGVSYSMGANLLLKYAGESKSNELKGIVSISNPLDLTKSNYMFSQFFGKHLYSSVICRDALHMFAGHKVEMSKLFNIVEYENIMKSKTLHDLDVCLSPKLYGYGTADLYYAGAGSGLHLSQIQVPTLIISSVDDPFVHESVLKHTNPNIIMAVTNRGGHLGFSEGVWPWALRNWTSEVISEYLDALRSTEK